MHGEIVAAFVAVALALIIIPGPDWAFVLGAGARDGRVISPVLGLGIGYFAVTTVVAAGLASVVEAFPIALDLLTIIGSGYLVFLGIGLIRRPVVTTVDEESTTRLRGGQLFRRGFAVAVFNPKGLLFFLALLPQFTDPRSDWPLWKQILVLGAIFLVVFLVFFAILGSIASRALASRPSIARITSRLSGIAMVLISLFLLVERALTVWGG